MSGTPKEMGRLFPNKFDNKEPLIPTSGTEVTFDFVGTATDTATTYNFGLGRQGAYHVRIRPSATVVIKELNGRTLSYPITISTDGYTDTKCEYQSMVIETGTDNTTIKAFAKGD